MANATVRLPPPWEGGQDDIFYWSENNPDAQCLVAPCGTKVGKAVSLQEVIPTPAGFRTVKQLKIGDLVFDEHGKPIRIIDVTEVMYGHDCYEVVLSDGNKVVADAGHLWVTQTHVERKNQARVLSPNDRTKSTTARPQIRTTEQIRDTLTVTIGGVERDNHSIDNVTGAVEFEEKDLPIDPYVLGVWLGDGTKTNGKITSADPEILDTFKSLGFDTDKIKSADYCYNVIGLAKALRINGLIDNKHIPDDYLIASPAQRLALLQGFLDTDGTIDKRGRCEFNNTNDNLAEGVALLAESLGIKVQRRFRMGKLYGEEKKPVYRIWFVTDLPVFRLKRKLERLRPVSIKAKRRMIVAVNKVESVPVKCISVDSPTKMFLVSKACIPTHNSFGSALWLAKESLVNGGVFCVWVAPTYLKCKIGYRYLKAMLDIEGVAKCVDGLLEIRLANGSFIKFLHGRDAEVTIEGEAVDRFIIDEAGKIAKQVWHSLLTTITQTGGIGIVTGTPRGFNWYYDVYRQAKSGNPFFAHKTLRTEDSPYVKKESIERNRRLIPKALYDQYYNAMFVSSSSVFGDLTTMWDESLPVPEGPVRFWIHPDSSKRKLDVVHGVDIAKKRDYTVFFSVNMKGDMVGFCRFKNSPYPRQAERLKLYIQKYFSDSEDNLVRFDETGVGTALGDMLSDLDIDASITPVTFTNKSKAEMVTRLSLAVEQQWLTVPRIEQIEHEMASYEMSVTKSGLHSYNAADGEHDDIVSACMLAVSAAYQSSMAEEAEKLLEEALTGKQTDRDDDILEYAKAGFDDNDDFFDDGYDNEADAEFEFEGTFG